VVVTRDCFLSGARDWLDSGTVDLAARVVGLARPGRMTLPGSRGSPARGEALELELFWASELAEDAHINERSLLLRVRAPGAPAAAVLFAGDAGQDAEADLVRLVPDLLRAEVLKVAHHGSGGSSSPAFVRAVQARIAVVSVGPNGFGHPAASAVQRLADAGCIVLRTDRVGWIECACAGPHIEVRSHLRERYGPGVFLPPGGMLGWSQAGGGVAVAEAGFEVMAPVPGGEWA
jgi:competence protein ComEC